MKFLLKMKLSFEKVTTPAIPLQGRAPWALFTGVEPLNRCAGNCIEAGKIFYHGRNLCAFAICFFENQ